jgi:hypothetical protein
MPVYKLSVFHEQTQDAKNCWWWGIRLIRKYHRDSTLSDGDRAWAHLDDQFKLINKDRPQTGLNRQNYEEEMTNRKMKRVPSSMWGPDNCEADDLRKVLKAFGPIIMAIFHPKMPSDHGIVITGVDTEKKVVWLIDPNDLDVGQWHIDSLHTFTNLKKDLPGLVSNEGEVEKWTDGKGIGWGNPWYYAGKHVNKTLHSGAKE